MSVIGRTAVIGLSAFVRYGPPNDFDDFCFQSVEGPNSEVSEDIEVTNSCSVQKEWLAGIIDGGTITMTFNMDPNQPQKASREEKPLTIFMPLIVGQPRRARYETQAYIKSAPAAIPAGDKLTQTITFKITGEERWFNAFNVQV